MQGAMINTQSRTDEQEDFTKNENPEENDILSFAYGASGCGLLLDLIRRPSGG
jgi:hypothetical protein